MAWLTHRDVAMHRVRLEVPCPENPVLLENIYEHFTLRTFYLFGCVPVWQAELNVERKPLHEFIGRVFG